MSLAKYQQFMQFDIEDDNQMSSSAFMEIKFPVSASFSSATTLLLICRYAAKCALLSSR